MNLETSSFSLSFVVLNWNRADLLERCLASIVPTTPAFDQCIVIDNNSSDHSRDVIAAWTRRDVRFKAMYQPENRGAEWINDAVAQITSDFIFILANDKQLLPGWFEYARSVFHMFPEIGQLALHAPAPLDNEVWVTKPARFTRRNRIGVFIADGNTGMSSILRTSLVSRGSVTFGNSDNSLEVRLPNDGKLSADIHAQGFRSAWSEKYYCLNLGHTIEEFKKEPDYYNANYEAKRWVKRAGLAARLNAYHETPRPARTGRVFEWRGEPEPTSGGLEPPERIWTMVEGGSPELEALEFIYALCRLVKPASVVAVRGDTGYVPAAAARALKDNDRGALAYVEPDPWLQASCARLAAAEDLSDVVRLAALGGDIPVDLLIVSGYFEEQDESWLGQILDPLYSQTRVVLLQRSPLPVTIKACIEKGLSGEKWIRMDLPTPRQISLLSRKMAG
jgi:glycosyltransferase involved in cell wall biosynthesis